MLRRSVATANSATGRNDNQESDKKFRWHDEFRNLFGSGVFKVVMRLPSFHTKSLF